jgi:bifunctional non-homologous end joining protein LigD
MAERLVAEMTEDWDPETYHDKFDIYRRKRDFARTPEPKGRTRGAAERRSFVVQRHAAKRLHYDFRLELDGVLKSWAVPKQPAPVPGQKRLAVHVEDHPLEYGSFEGEIPAGHYGAGKVVIWDQGWWEPAGDPRAGYRKGALQFILHGRKLRGRWALVRMRARDEAGDGKESWLLIKERDAPAREKPRAR